MHVHNTHNLLIGYLFWIFGFLGSHRFYYGKTLSGVIYFFTLGLLFIGWIVDLFLMPRLDAEANRLYRSGAYDYNVAWLLHVFLGLFGVHHFYLGHWITGIIYLFTGGLLGIGWIYDWLTLNEQIHEANVKGVVG